MRWAGNIARVVRGEVHSVLLRKPEENIMEDLGVGGRILLKCVFKKLDGETRTRLLWLWHAVVDAVMNLWVP